MQQMTFISVLQKIFDQIPQLEDTLGIRDKGRGLVENPGHEWKFIKVFLGEINWEGDFTLFFDSRTGELQKVTRSLWDMDGKVASRLVDPKTYREGISPLPSEGAARHTPKVETHE